MGEPGDLGVHEPCGLHRQPEGGLGDPAGPPHRQLTGLGAVPEPGEPVLQLHRVRDQRPPGVGGAPERGRELGNTELRHQRRPWSGQRETGVPTTTDPGRRVVDRLRRVLLGPQHRRRQQVRLAPGRLRPGRSARTRAPPRRSPDRAGSSSYLNSTTDHRQSRTPETLAHKGILTGFEPLDPTPSSTNRARSRSAEQNMHQEAVAKWRGDGCLSPFGTWSRLIARFARCSTT